MMHHYMKINKNLLSRILCFMLLLCLSLGILTACGTPAVSEDTSNVDESSVEQAETSSDSKETSEEVSDDVGALMLGDLYVLNNMDIYKWNTPKNLSQDSTEEEAVRYAAIRSGLPYVSKYIQEGDPREWEDSNQLFYYVASYIYHVMVDEDFNVVVEYETREEDSAFMYTRETITEMVERIFGISNVDVDARSWDAKRDRYVIIYTHGLRDKDYEIQLAGEVNWINQNKYTLSVYCYTTTELEEVVVEDWYRRIDLTMERDEQEIYTFYVTGIDIVENK